MSGFRIIGIGILAVVTASLSGAESTDEASRLAAVDAAELQRHAKEIVQYRRDGGSADEHAAVAYIVDTLKADGIAVELHQFPAYVSDPGRCRLAVEGAEPASPICKTQALAAPTPPEGVQGELVFVGHGAEGDYAGKDVAGKVVLVDDLPLPWGVKNAEDAGAVGAIFMSYSELIQELTVSPIWGTPTHLNYGELTKIPSININKPDGDALREALSSGSVRVAIESGVDTGWKTLHLAVATVLSPKDDDGYVLVGGHIDGWHYAAVDEGASNAAMIEMARIFQSQRDELERSLKVAWWPAHSNGRYAGSAWYVDHAWMDLRQNALAYMNIDGVGQIGAEVYRSSNTASMDELASAVLRDVAEVDAEQVRPGRNSDQGFYGVGLPLLQFNHGRVDPGGRYWFWHTEEDTFDKIDFDVLASDTRLYVAALSRLLTQPVPPMRLGAATAELKARLETRRDWAGPHFDLSESLRLVGELDDLVRGLDERLQSASLGASATDISRRMVRVLRPVLRITYQQDGPYHQDPALNVPTLPGLASLEFLGTLDRDADMYGFTVTHLMKERNRVEDHLTQSLTEAQALQAMLGSGSEN